VTALATEDDPADRDGGGPYIESRAVAFFQTRQA